MNVSDDWDSEYGKYTSVMRLQGLVAYKKTTVLFVQQLDNCYELTSRQAHIRPMTL